MLARYGNGGKITAVATEESYAVAAAYGVAQQNHWYARCNKDDEKEKKCCSNSGLVSDGFNWNDFGHGNTCASDSEQDNVVTEVYCVFDDDALAIAETPPQPKDLLVVSECMCVYLMDSHMLMLLTLPQGSLVVFLYTNLCI